MPATGTDEVHARIRLILRYACGLSSLLLISSLFHYGAQPVAVGLFAPPVDKLAHAGLFGLLAALLWLVFDRRHPLLVIGLVAMIAATDEVYQAFLPGRYADVSDWVADVSGAAIPLIILVLSRKNLRAAQ